MRDFPKLCLADCRPDWDTQTGHTQSTGLRVSRNCPRVQELEHPDLPASHIWELPPTAEGPMVSLRSPSAHPGEDPILSLCSPKWRHTQSRPAYCQPLQRRVPSRGGLEQIARNQFHMEYEKPPLNGKRVDETPPLSIVKVPPRRRLVWFQKNAVASSVPKFQGGRPPWTLSPLSRSSTIQTLPA